MLNEVIKSNAFLPNGLVDVKSGLAMREQYIGPVQWRSHISYCSSCFNPVTVHVLVAALQLPAKRPYFLLRATILTVKNVGEWETVIESFVRLSRLSVSVTKIVKTNTYLICLNNVHITSKKLHTILWESISSHNA